MKAMRDVWGDTLVALGKVNPNVVVLDADLANSTKADKFAKTYPARLSDRIKQVFKCTKCESAARSRYLAFIPELEGCSPLQPLLESQKSPRKHQCGSIVAGRQTPIGLR